MTTTTTTSPCILWSSIVRDETVLVEAHHRDIQDQHQHQRGQRTLPPPSSSSSSSSSSPSSIRSIVDETAQLLLAKKPTPGWEHVTVRRRPSVAGGSRRRSSNSIGGGSGGFGTGGATKLKGTKFHVYEHCGNDENDQWMFNSTTINDCTDRGSEFGVPTSSTVGTNVNNGLTVWTFACVYDPSLVDEYQAKAFLEKIVTLTEVFRQPTIPDDPTDEMNSCNLTSITTTTNTNPFSTEPTSIRTEHETQEDIWRYGSTYAAQKSFSPVLLQRMEEVSYLGKLAMCHEQLDAAKAVMARNIDLIIEQDERLENVISRKAEECNEMAAAFRKKSKQVKRQMLWNNAKHGLILGTAITAGVATVAVPALIAIL